MIESPTHSINSFIVLVRVPGFDSLWSINTLKGITIGATYPEWYNADGTWGGRE